MAGDFSGTEYVGIDQNAWGDGTSDDTTHALSTYLENRLDANARYLQNRGSQVTYQFYQDGNSEKRRPYTSPRRSSLLYLPWPIRTDLKEITVRIFGEVLNDDSHTTGEMKFFLTVTDPAGETVSPATATMTATGALDAQTITLDLSSASLEPGLGAVSLEMKSNNRPAVGAGNTVQDDGDHLGDVQNLSSFDATDGLFFSTGTPKEVAIGVGHRSPDPDNSSVKAFTWLEPSPFDITGVSTAAPVALSYIEPLSVAVEERFEETGNRSIYSVKDAFEMRAQKPVLGQHTSRHGTNLDGIWQRERCLAIGPQGEDKGVDWPSGEKRKWTWQADIENNNNALLDEQMLQLRDDGRVWCYAWLASFYQIRGTGNLTDQIFGAYDVGATSDQESYFDYTEIGDAEFRVKLEQLEDGDTGWSGATELANKTDIFDDFEVHLSAPVNFAHLPTQFYFARHPEGGTSEASDFHATFREGQLWPEARVGTDRLVMTPIAISADIPSDVNQADPVRATLEFSQFDVAPGYEDESSQNAEILTHMLCLQTTWFEEASL